MKRKTFLVLLLLFSVLVPAPAQTTTSSPSQPQTPSDDDDVVKISTNLVQIDAVVTKDGKPVTNLTADDFEIYDNGKRQAITSFAYISNVPGSTLQPVTKEKGANVVPFTPLKRDDPHRTVAFVVDDLGLSAESMHQVRRQLRKFLAEEVQPNDLIAIIRTGGVMGALQQFTNDQRVLTRAVDQLRWNICSRVGIYVFQPRGGAGPSRCGGRSYLNTMSSLRFILDSMAQLPGRKSLVLLSDSIPRESQDEIFTERGVLRDEGIIEDGNDSIGDESYINYSSILQKIAERAIRASVVIYGVDTQGLAVTGITAADRFGGDINQVTQQMRGLIMARSQLLHARREGTEILSRQTGGFLIRNSNSFQLNRIVEDQAGYYLLGYRPTEETFNRRFHHIKAKVKRSGMSLRTRYGFFGVTEEEVERTRQLTTADQTNLALASPFRAQDLEVDLTSFFANEKPLGSMVSSFIYLGVKELTFNLVNGQRQASIEIHGLVFGDNGTIAEQIKRGATINLSDSDYEHAVRNGFGIGLNMPVKRHGSYQVRVAIRDRNSAKIGSAGQFVMVPNLKDKRLAVSGIVLGTVPDFNQTKPEGDGVANPGSRKFPMNSNLYFGYRLYNATVDSSSQLRDMVMEAKLFRDGKQVFNGPETPIRADGQTDLTRVFASGVVKLTPDLEPGNYYLQVTITEKNAKSKVIPVVQWVDFEIVK